MQAKNRHKKRTITPEEEDKPFMIESLIFVILMVICAGGLIYALVHLVRFIANILSVDTSP